MGGLSSAMVGHRGGEQRLHLTVDCDGLGRASRPRTWLGRGSAADRRTHHHRRSDARQDLQGGCWPDDILRAAGSKAVAGTDSSVAVDSFFGLKGLWVAIRCPDSRTGSPTRLPAILGTRQQPAPHRGACTHTVAREERTPPVRNYGESFMTETVIANGSVTA